MDNQSLAHSRYNCTYHIVFIPKYRRKSDVWKVTKRCRRDIRKSMQDGRSNNIKSCNSSRTCTYVCIDSAEIKCIKNNRSNQRKECINDIRQTSGI